MKYEVVTYTVTERKYQVEATDLKEAIEEFKPDSSIKPVSENTNPPFLVSVNRIFEA